jgi:hypothetical protein
MVNDHLVELQLEIAEERVNGVDFFFFSSYSNKIFCSTSHMLMRPLQEESLHHIKD